MKASQKFIGVVSLVAFAFMAGSVICLASGHASIMGDCGNSMTTGTMCPFMSVSVQAVANASSLTMRLLGLVAILVFATGFIFRRFLRDNHPERFLAIMRERTRDSATGRRSDTVLNLISDGILHSRVFDF